MNKTKALLGIAAAGLAALATYKMIINPSYNIEAVVDFNQSKTPITEKVVVMDNPYRNAVVRGRPGENLQPTDVKDGTFLSDFYWQRLQREKEEMTEKQLTDTSAAYQLSRVALENRLNYVHLSDGKWYLEVHVKKPDGSTAVDAIRGLRK